MVLIAKPTGPSKTLSDHIATGRPLCPFRAGGEHSGKTHCRTTRCTEMGQISSCRTRHGRRAPSGNVHLESLVVSSARNEGMKYPESVSQVECHSDGTHFMTCQQQEKFERARVHSSCRAHKISAPPCLHGFFCPTAACRARGERSAPRK
jgi:hypothetical protein